MAKLSFKQKTTAHFLNSRFFVVAFEILVSQSNSTGILLKDGWISLGNGLILEWGYGTNFSNGRSSGYATATIPKPLNKLLVAVGNIGNTDSSFHDIGALGEMWLTNQSTLHGRWDSFAYPSNPSVWRYVIIGLE